MYDCYCVIVHCLQYITPPTLSVTMLDYSTAIFGYFTYIDIGSFPSGFNFIPPEYAVRGMWGLGGKVVSTRESLEFENVTVPFIGLM